MCRNECHTVENRVPRKQRSRGEGVGVVGGSRLADVYWHLVFLYGSVFQVYRPRKYGTHYLKSYTKQTVVTAVVSLTL